MRHQIQYVDHRAAKTPLILCDTFSYHPERGMKWLQRLCFWWLRLRGLNHETIEVKTIKTVAEDGSPALEVIMKQRFSIEEFFNVDAECLLIGAEDYAELMRTMTPEQMLSFQSQARIGRDRQIEIYGLTVTIIPWMKGVLLLPKNRG